jgi:hypothetical protein
MKATREQCLAMAREADAHESVVAFSAPTHFLFEFNEDQLEAFAHKLQQFTLDQLRLQKPDFCDKNCTWRDHHPDCERAEPVVEHNRPMIAAILPNGATASNVYEAYTEGCKSVQPVQEPVSFYIYKETAPRLNLPNVVIYALPWVYDQDPSSGFSARLKVYLAPPDQTAEIERLRHDLMVRETVKDERIATLEAYREEALEWLDELAAMKAGDVVMVPREPKGWDVSRYSYTAIFNAIAAATRLYANGQGIEISVAAFNDAMIAAAPGAATAEDSSAPDVWESNKMREFYCGAVRDAKRYRWYRAKVMESKAEDVPSTDEEFDAAIDKAMSNAVGKPTPDYGGRP